MYCVAYRFANILAYWFARISKDEKSSQPNGFIFLLVCNNPSSFLYGNISLLSFFQQAMTLILANILAHRFIRISQHEKKDKSTTRVSVLTFVCERTPFFHTEAHCYFLLTTNTNHISRQYIGVLVDYDFHKTTALRYLIFYKKAPLCYLLFYKKKNTLCYIAFRQYISETLEANTPI